jgi:hypothetical protein
MRTGATALSVCGTALPLELFSEEWQRPIDAFNAGRRSYLMGFDYGAQRSFDLMQSVATTAPSVLLRDQAVDRLSMQTVSSEGYGPVPPGQVPAWKAFFRARLEETTSAGRFASVWRGITGLRDDVPLALAGQKLHTVTLSAKTQYAVVCGAYDISQVRPGAWDEFREAAKPWETLAAAAAAALRDPSVCQSGY